MFSCKYCNQACIRKGWQSGRQKLFCKSCNKNQQAVYAKRNINSDQKKLIVMLNNEGCSISSIGRIIGFSKTSIMRMILLIGKTLIIQTPQENNAEYEVDELRTFVGNKKNESWIMYALNKATKKVESFAIGRRTKENIQKVISVLLKSKPKRVYTDRLGIYFSLIPEYLHEFKKRVTNNIERRNLHLRQQLRRLQRKTICFSKSENMLRNSVAIFFASE